MERGRVIRAESDRILVELEGGPQCMHCAARQACQALAEGQRQIELPVNVSARPGDQVVIQYKSRPRVLSALLVFLLPSVFLILGYFAGASWFASQGWPILSAFAGLVLAFVFLRAAERWLSRQKVFLPEITTVVARRQTSGLRPRTEQG